jgi:hypothetical protein
MTMKRSLFVGLMTMLVCVASPSLGQAQTLNMPTECQKQWRQHKGFTPECFQDGFNGRPVTAIVLITQTQDDGWSGFAQVYRLVDGEVRLVADSPLTTSRYGLFPEMLAPLGPYQKNVGELKLDGFSMLRVRGLKLTNGHVIKSANVALHGPVSDNRNTPARATSLGSFVPPSNPQGQGSRYCFRWAMNWKKASKEIYDARKSGQVVWLVTHKKP